MGGRTLDQFRSQQQIKAKKSQQAKQTPKDPDDEQPKYNKPPQNSDHS